MQINRQSWHARLYGKTDRPTSLCGYFWTVVGKILGQVFDFVDNFCKLMVIVAGVLAALYMLFTVIADDPIHFIKVILGAVLAVCAIILFGLSLIASLIFADTAFGAEDANERIGSNTPAGKIRAWFAPTRARAASFKQVVIAYAKAVKQRVCPFIEFVD